MPFQEATGGDRTLRSASDLRAFSHPLRLRLLELLDREGPLTATQAAALAGTTASNASFHLRLLARHGFVEEAPGGTGRQRPWRAVDRTMTVHTDELDPDGRLELRGLVEIMAQRYRNNALAWLRHRDDYPTAWRGAAGDTHLVLHLTPQELAGLRRTITAELTALADATEAAPREGRLPIAVTFSALPLHATDEQERP